MERAKFLPVSTVINRKVCSMARKTYHTKRAALAAAGGKEVYRVKGPPRGWRISRGAKVRGARGRALKRNQAKRKKSKRKKRKKKIKWMFVDFA